MFSQLLFQPTNLDLNLKKCTFWAGDVCCTPSQRSASSSPYLIGRVSTCSLGFESILGAAFFSLVGFCNKTNCIVLQWGTEPKINHLCNFNLFYRCNLRCCPTFPVRMSLGSPGPAAGSCSQHPVSDAPPRCKCGGIHQLPRQRGFQVL